jgi:plasmid replication initiation protein
MSRRPEAMLKIYIYARCDRREQIQAVNHRDRNFTSAKQERRVRGIEASISHYLVEMDIADRQEPTIAKAKTERLQGEIAARKEQMQTPQASRS